MLLLLVAFLIILALTAVCVVVVREVNRTTEVEAAPAYSLPEATDFVIARLDQVALRRLRRSDVERLVRYCLSLLESAGMALSTSRPQGEELAGEELVLDTDGLARAMTEGTTVVAEPADRQAIAAAFIEYLVAIGAVGEEAGESGGPPD